jgi:hypothetical protein
VVACGGITDDGEVVDLEVPDRACLYGAGDAAGGGGGTRRRCFFGRVLFRVGR